MSKVAEYLEVHTLYLASEEGSKEEDSLLCQLDILWYSMTVEERRTVDTKDKP